MRYITFNHFNFLMETKFRKEILSLEIFTSISNNDIKIIKEMSSDKLQKAARQTHEENKREDRLRHKASLFVQ